MHRPSEVFQEEFDGEDIEQHPEGAADPVMRVPGGAGRAVNGNLGHARAVEAGKSGDEAVQLSVQIDVLEHLGAIRLKSSAEVAQLDAGSLGHEPVGNARGDSPGESVVRALPAPAAGNVVPLIDFAQQRGDVFGGMLKVAIHGDDDVALGFVKAGRKGRCLAEVAAQPDDLQMSIGLHQIGQQLEAAVGRGVVDKQDFIGTAEQLQYGRKPVVQGQDGGLLVVDGDYNRQHANSLSVSFTMPALCQCYAST